MCKGTEAGESTVGPENPYSGHECKEFEVYLSVSLKQGAGNSRQRPLGSGGLGGCRKWVVEDGGGERDHREPYRHVRTLGLVVVVGLIITSV